MIVLSRQRDESIIIGDDVSVTVVDIRGDKVRLGTNAPREISVHRKEIYDLIMQQKKEKKAEQVVVAAAAIVFHPNSAIQQECEIFYRSLHVRQQADFLRLLEKLKHG